MQTEEWIAIINTMGHAVLIETLKSASYYLSHSDMRHCKNRMTTMYIKEARSCYVFVQGTGLDRLIVRLGMDYDPDKLRDGFNYWVRQSV